MQILMGDPESEDFKDGSENTVFWEQGVAVAMSIGYKLKWE